MKKLALGLSIALAVSGCATEGGMSKSQQGAVMGAVLGAVAGNQRGGSSKDRREDRIKGIIIGAAGGAGIGHMMDKQEEEFNQALAQEQANSQIEVQRVTDEVLQLTLSSEVSFDVNSAVIKGSFKNSLDKLADVLSRYRETNIRVVGHTDSSGSDSYNQKLSVKRAQAVVIYLQRYGINGSRMRAEGRGESEPRASNGNATGRRMNRRVEVFVEQY